MVLVVGRGCAIRATVISCERQSIRGNRRGDRHAVRRGLPFPCRTLRRRPGSHHFHYDVPRPGERCSWNRRSARTFRSRRFPDRRCVSSLHYDWRGELPGNRGNESVSELHAADRTAVPHPKMQTAFGNRRRSASAVRSKRSRRSNSNAAHEASRSWFTIPYRANGTAGSITRDQATHADRAPIHRFRQGGRRASRYGPDCPKAHRWWQFRPACPQ